MSYPVGATRAKWEQSRYNQQRRLRLGSRSSQATPVEEFNGREFRFHAPHPAATRPNESWSRRLTASRNPRLLVVKGLLDSAALMPDMTSVDAIQEMFPGVGGTVILVREEDAVEARRLIEEYRERRPQTTRQHEVDLSETRPHCGLTVCQSS